MTSSSILLALLLGMPPQAPAAANVPPAAAPSTFAYLKPSVAPVPADCKGAKAVAGLVQVPLFGEDSGACPVARIGEDRVMLSELSETLAAAHEERGGKPGGQVKGADQQFGPALERLIRVRLVVDEAEGMGMADLPDVKELLARFDLQVARLALETQATEGIEADPAETERLYQRATREWKVKSLLFEKKPDAAAFVKAVRAGGSFDALAAKAVAAKKARGGGEAEAVRAGKVQAEVGKALDKMKVGGLSSPVVVPGGFAVVQVVALGHFDDPAMRTIARESSQTAQKKKALSKLYDELVEKYARIDKALVEKLDWEAKKPGHEALAKDQRVVVTIQGEKPVTVADLTLELASTFFHGLDAPVKEKRVNREKKKALQEILARRLFVKESLARGLQDGPAVKRATLDYRRAVLFGGFVEKVIVPDVKVTEPDAQGYYARHATEYSYPQMFKLDGIAFTSAKGAEDAVERLRTGTDFQWLRANADGQVAAKERSLPVDVASVVMASSLPAGLSKALAGSSTGDYRIYPAAEKEVYVIRVVENVPARLQPYLEVREAAARAVYDEKLIEAVTAYADKLRAAADVEIYLARIGS
jgi:parvulin-like peptidyl-prolyl isomerase